MAADDCRQKALDLLARRSHFRRQLEEKLRARRFASDVIARTLDELAELGYLDDRRAAEEFATARLRRGPVGRRRMRHELERRGADPDAVERALDATYADASDLEMAREAATRWRRRGGTDPDRLARHLDRLGFAGGSIVRVLDEARERDAET